MNGEIINRGNNFRNKLGRLKNFMSSGKMMGTLGNSVVSGVSKIRNEKVVNKNLRYGLILLTFGIIIVSILILKASSGNFTLDYDNRCNKNDSAKYRNNVPGLIIGLLILLFSFIILLFLFFGNSIIIKFSTFFYWGIGSLFFLAILTIMIGFLFKDEKYELFGSKPAPRNSEGPCEENGEFGYYLDGKCIVDPLGDGKCMKKLDNCKKKENESCDKKIKEAVKDELKRQKDIVNLNSENIVASLGICEYEDFENKRQFGYSHPALGKKCLSPGKLSKFLKCYPEYNKVTPISLNGVKYNPYQSTDCYAYPKNDLLSYDLKCKKKYGKKYGVKIVEGFGCPPNDNRGLCEIDYQMGVEISADSTKCVPIGTEMNGVCQAKHIREKKNKFTKMGYKSIEFSGCPKGYQRAICDGNYYDGKELFENATECFEQSFDPNRMCKEKFGKLSFVDKIISDNCNPGYIRASCKNIKK